MKKTNKFVILIGAIGALILMVSTATAVPQVNGSIIKNVIERKEKSVKQLNEDDFLSNDKYCKIVSKINEVINSNHMSDQADKIDSLSQKIKGSYDSVMKVYQKEIIDGMTQLIKGNDSMLAKTLKEGTANLKTAKTSLSSKWNATAKKYESDLNNAVRDVLKETNPKITSTAKEAVNNTLKHVDSLKAGISTTQFFNSPIL